MVTLMETELWTRDRSTHVPAIVQEYAHVGLATSFVMTPVMLVGCLHGTSALPPPDAVVTALTNQTFSSHLASLLDEAGERSAVLSDAAEVHWLKENSGLTWEQLGKAFGVSRRAVHLWANGGRMNESNATTLRELAAQVRKLGSTSPEDARARLLAIGPEGRSVIDEFRIRAASGDSLGAPFAPDELVGALQDD